MQGRIAGTRLNSLLLGMVLELLAIFVCASSIGMALRAASRSRRDNGEAVSP